MRLAVVPSLVALVALVLVASCASAPQVSTHTPQWSRAATPKEANSRARLVSREADLGGRTPHASRAPLEEGATDPRFFALSAPIEAAIAEHKLPGAVVVIGRHDEVLFHRAFGSRALIPEREPMTEDTIFDLASLTKVIATTTSLMILASRGAVDLDARASSFVPELASLPPFTVRDLLLHTSGLPAEVPLKDCHGTREALMRQIGALKLRRRPGERFVYSDAGFLVLEEIVRRASGTDLRTFSAREIFAPLGMTETTFLPDKSLNFRVAPTELVDGVVLRGTVHDPRAAALGGVAGHAGLFSTASDLTRFAQAMLGRGALLGRRIVSEPIFDVFLTRHETSSGGRALGWDKDSRYATHRGTRFSPSAFGHGGFTGTAMWIDPERDLFLVFLSNRVHPDGKGTVNPLIGELATLAVEASDVRTGVDVLTRESFARLSGTHVGLVTNESATTAGGETTIAAFRSAPNVTLSAIFTPEHGLFANSEGKIKDDRSRSVPVFSLYGEHTEPSASSLANIDTLVVDLQDVGTRFYTYASTMKRVMKVAAERNLRFVVLDRPNPLGGVDVEGPVAMESSASFVNHHALAVRHGMTMGELASMFAADDALALTPEIVRLENWRRKDYFDHTGLSWTRPSPNLRNVRSAVLYPMLGLLEATNLSVGRGTNDPFEQFGAPWLDERALLARLEAAGPSGLRFEPTTFTPKASVYAGQPCRGLRVTVDDRAAFHPVHAAIVLALALHAQHPTEWEVTKVHRLLQNTAATDALVRGASVEDVEALWAPELRDFVQKRERFLLYR